ncbi:MAG: hypothetical protein U9R21_01835 [Candidatus Thermoplasmatota archaeon]|nr:hypothetical protein [Candidatus Thermoplasmatota archaeon]
MNKETNEPISLDLKVRKSDIERVGVVRLNDKILSKLGVEEGERVTVSTDEQTILRKAFGDEAVKNDEIFLRPTSREELDVEEGDVVRVEDYETLSEDIKESLGDIKEKTGKSIGSIRKKLGAGVTKIKEKFRKEEEDE